MPGRLGEIVQGGPFFPAPSAYPSKTRKLVLSLLTREAGYTVSGGLGRSHSRACGSTLESCFGGSPASRSNP